MENISLMMERHGLQGDCCVTAFFILIVFIYQIDHYF